MRATASRMYLTQLLPRRDKDVPESRTSQTMDVRSAESGEVLRVCTHARDSAFRRAIEAQDLARECSGVPGSVSLHCAHSRAVCRCTLRHTAARRGRRPSAVPLGRACSVTSRQGLLPKHRYDGIGSGATCNCKETGNHASKHRARHLRLHITDHSCPLPVHSHWWRVLWAPRVTGAGCHARRRRDRELGTAPR